MKDMQPPVKVDETYDVVIKNIGEKGDGIVKVKGFVIFVGNVKEGDHVKIKVTKVLKKVGFGEVVERYKDVFVEPPKVENPKVTDSFGEDLDKEDELDEFEKLAKD